MRGSLLPVPGTDGGDLEAWKTACLVHVFTYICIEFCKIVFFHNYSSFLPTCSCFSFYIYNSVYLCFFLISPSTYYLLFSLNNYFGLICFLDILFHF